jgi:hypothetical protein
MLKALVWFLPTLQFVDCFCTVYHSLLLCTSIDSIIDVNVFKNTFKLRGRKIPNSSTYACIGAELDVSTTEISHI